MITLENELIKVGIKKIGAELCSLVKKDSQTEYMWSADANYWAKTSPVLFPIVGSLKNATYNYQNKEYTLERHGFARTKTFEIESKTTSSVCFLLKSDAETIINYPFDFELRLIYTLENCTLKLNYFVTNVGSSDMYFSIGAHPAFAVPIDANLKYDDYYLEFNKNEEFARFPLNNEGLVEQTPIKFNENKNKIELNHELFHGDALVLKNLSSNKICIKSDKTIKALEFEFDGYPFFGIWAAKDADFVCLEPWCGIADAVNHDQDLTKKEGIIKLATQDKFERNWSVTLH